MAQYVIYWEPTKEQNLLNVFPELDVQNSTLEEPTPEWADGYKWVEQNLTPEQFMIVDSAANAYVAIDVKPAPHPPYSPTGR